MLSIEERFHKIEMAVNQIEEDLNNFGLKIDHLFSKFKKLEGEEDES